MSASNAKRPRRGGPRARSVLRYAAGMRALKAKVANGRIVVDVPTELPDGTEVDLVVADVGDDLDEAERGELHEAIDEGLAELRAGAEGTDSAAVIRKLRTRS